MQLQPVCQEYNYDGSDSNGEYAQDSKLLYLLDFTLQVLFTKNTIMMAQTAMESMHKTLNYCTF